VVGSSSTKKVKAAGGVLWRHRHGQTEVLLVHRPRYGDWSFPKGKLDRGETFLEAAVREVREETGLRVDVGAELDAAHYHDALGRPKIVRYWEMTVTGGEFGANAEVDKVRWLPIHEVAARLTYPHDTDVLVSFEILQR